MWNLARISSVVAYSALFCSRLPSPISHLPSLFSFSSFLWISWVDGQSERPVHHSSFVLFTLWLDGFQILLFILLLWLFYHSISASLFSLSFVGLRRWSFSVRRMRFSLALLIWFVPLGLPFRMATGFFALSLYFSFFGFCFNSCSSLKSERASTLLVQSSS